MQTWPGQNWRCNYRFENEYSLVAKEQIFQSSIRKNAKIGDQSILSDLSILHVFILSDDATKGRKEKT